MKAVLIIAVNTFKETIRNRVLYNVLLVACCALFLSMSFGELSVFSRVQVMTDFGLATMSLTGLLLAVFIGIGMLGTEISSKTVYCILTKPVPREAFIAGKFVGLLLTLLLNLLLIAGVFFLSIQLSGATVRFAVFQAVLLIAVEMGLIIGASIFFSSFTSPTLAAIFTIGFFIAGHLNNMVGVSAHVQRSDFWRSVLRGLSFLLPNLEHFNIRTRIVYELAIPKGYIVSALTYGVLYTAVLLLLSILLFSRKDL